MTHRCRERERIERHRLEAIRLLDHGCGAGVVAMANSTMATMTSTSAKHNESSERDVDR